MKKIGLFITFLIVLLTLNLSTLTHANMVQDEENPFSYFEDVKITKAASRGARSIVLTDDGRVFTWGRNAFGVLGDGTEINRPAPVEITHQFNLIEDESILDFSLGTGHTSVLTSDGRLFVWGKNWASQLGDDTSINRMLPTEITHHFDLIDNETIIRVFLGHDHSSAITSTGRIFTWGSNLQGQLGDGTTIHRQTPTDITQHFSLDLNETIQSIDLGGLNQDSHSAALTSRGRVFTWGSNRYGQLGDGTRTNRLIPTDITDNFDLKPEELIVQTSLGNDHSVARTSTGRVFTWGHNQVGRLGDGHGDDQLYPSDITHRFQLSSRDNINHIVANSFNTMVITQHGRVFFWGSSWMFDNAWRFYSTPQDLTQEFDLRFLELPMIGHLGRDHQLIITSEGRVFTWGFNEEGQLGNGSLSPSLMPQVINPYFNRVFITPEPFFPSHNIDLFSLSRYHSLALDKNHQLFAWGANNFGQLGNDSSQGSPYPINITSRIPLTEDEIVDQIFTGPEHSAVLTSMGRLFVWGSNRYRQLSQDNIDVIKRPMDISHLFALDDDEFIIDKQMNASSTHLALTSKGRVFFWGRVLVGESSYSIRTSPSDITKDFDLLSGETIAQISIGNQQQAILTSHGRVFMWGRNSSGQLGNGTNTASPTPVDITSQFTLRTDESITKVVTSQWFTGALTSQGRVFIWGSNNGRFGNGTYASSNTPVDVTRHINTDPAELITNLSLGNYHVSALTSFGRIFLWGENGFGQLGTGFSHDQKEPVDIFMSFGLDDNEYIASVELGGYHSFAMTTEGRLFVWGSNYSGQLGTNSSLTENLPTEILVDLGYIQKLYVSDSPIENQTFTLSIFPIFEMTNLESIKINTTHYDSSHFTNVNGRIDVTILMNEVYKTNPAFKIHYFKLTDGTLVKSRGFNLTDKDVTPPTFDEISAQTIEAGAYEALDWTTFIQNALDNVDYELVLSIEEDTVDYSSPGTYTVTVGVSDQSGNKTTQTFEVIVKDTIAPTFDEIENQTIEAGAYEAFDWTTLIKNAEDNSSDELIYAIEEDKVEYKTPGTYTVTVSVSDQSGNKYTQTFEVNVQDTTPPTFDGLTNIVIELTDEKPSFLERVTAYDLVDGDVTKHITVDDSKVDYTQPGEYTVTYRVSDQAGNTQAETIKLRIIDLTPPTVHLNASLDTLMQGQEFDDAGVNVTHVYDVATEVSGSVNTDVPGVYTLTYTVTDVFDNVTTVKRIVTVLASSPTIEFRLNPAQTTLRVGEVYQDTGCVAFVNDNEITCQIKENNVDTTQPGVHTMVYSISYQSEEYTYTRYVFVKDGDIPLTLYSDVKRREGDEII